MCQCSQTRDTDVPLPALQASISRLMTLYHVQPCPGKAHAIVRLIGALLEHPEHEHWEPMTDIYQHLLQTWSSIAASSRKGCPRPMPVSSAAVH